MNQQVFKCFSDDICNCIEALGDSNVKTPVGEEEES